MKNRLQILFITLTIIGCIVPISLAAQEENGFQAEKYVVNKDTLNYRILFPKNFSSEEQYPLVLFLHGAG
ncbi:MAG: phospholipase, partial [Gillisia sp.]